MHFNTPNLRMEIDDDSSKNRLREYRENKENQDEWTQRFCDVVVANFEKLEMDLIEEYTQLSRMREQKLVMENAALRANVEKLKGKAATTTSFATNLTAEGNKDVVPEKTKAKAKLPSAFSAMTMPPKEAKLPSAFSVMTIPPMSAPGQENEENGAPRHSTSAASEVSTVSTGVVKLSPEIARAGTVGGFQLHDDFWHETARDPDHDHGFMELAHHRDMMESMELPWYVINPTGNLKLGWDVLGIPVLGWDLVTIPMSVYDIGDIALWIVMGWVTLIYWSIDIPFCFLTGYWDNNGDIITDHRKIAMHYIRSMFVMDVIIIGSDWLSTILELVVEGGSPDWIKNVAILRALRITRFARLMRLRKLKSKWQNVEDHINIEWNLVCLNLVGKIFAILSITHYIGCAWFLLGEMSINGYDTWLITTYPMYGKNRITLGGSPWGYQYWTSLHWALTQFTPGSMHVQPQNIPERMFAIFCLLFGMVVFSSFVAAVTQARMQLNKMMSKFERDLWLLRKYCRQNRVSSSLRIRMKRYIDLVLIPQFDRMTEEDVTILRKLSKSLREELQTEKNCNIICSHPFFDHLRTNKAAITKICNCGISHILVAKGDVVFATGQVARWMLWVKSGSLDYIPHGQDHKMERLERGRWILEAALWSTWVTQGQLQGCEESSGAELDAVAFRNTMKENPMYASYARKYAHAFLAELNKSWKDSTSVPSDNQEEVALTLAREDYFKKNILTATGSLGNFATKDDTDIMDQAGQTSRQTPQTVSVVANSERLGKEYL